MWHLSAGRGATIKLLNKRLLVSPQRTWCCADLHHYPPRFCSRLINLKTLDIEYHLAHTSGMVDKILGLSSKIWTYLRILGKHIGVTSYSVLSDSQESDVSEQSSISVYHKSSECAVISKYQANNVNHKLITSDNLIEVLALFVSSDPDQVCDVCASSIT